MINKKIFAIMLSSAFLIADDLIVDKTSISQYLTNNFLLFDNYASDNTLNGMGMYSDTIDISTKAIILGSSFSQEAWIFSDQKGAKEQIIIGSVPTSVRGADTSPIIATSGFGKNILFGFGDGSDFYGKDVDNVISANTWHHVAVTFDGTDYILYIDGNIIYTYSGASGKIPVNTPIKSIGLRFRGRIDENKR